ncbi:hypothetical protein [Prevotella sp. OH937_COT-195]|uniref:hypothetical protein n=1 Tax=Prevotella sp. OH937_COT-195 TaxID=2491051 RepID=UPI000F64C706|nr:hypothetical protein [Prevotella sp. OH937_COT-195]RRC96771.1 hypothetical protein EII32_11050 [Prevotella sp. OH937_COT-195]
MKQYKREKDGVTEFFREPLIKDGKQIFNASEEEMNAAGWEEYNPPPASVENYEPAYEEKVVMLIRERYSVDDEIALLRQRNIKEQEYREYFEFCERCKERARTENSTDSAGE